MALRYVNIISEITVVELFDLPSVSTSNILTMIRETVQIHKINYNLT